MTMPKSYKLFVDELNVLRSDIETQLRKENKLNPIDMADSVLDLLIMAYSFGNTDAKEALNEVVNPSFSKTENAIYKKVDGKSFADRVFEYSANNDVDGIMLVADTEGHRIYNQAIIDTAEKSGKELYKVWRTMNDDKVRDTHSYLEASRVPINAKFYTYDGDSGLFPGDFSLPQNNCNCRCVIELSTNP